MAYQGLADLLERLGHEGELARVEAEVDPRLEVAEITRRVAHTGGPALLFGAVRGHSFPVLTNLLGTDARISLVLGVDGPTEIAGRLAELVDSEGPQGWLERIRSTAGRAMLQKSSPRIVRSGPCQQVVRLGDDVDLTELPALQSCPLECGRVITAGQAFSCESRSGRTSAARYDFCVADQKRLAACWSAHDEAARLLVDHRQRGEPMPVAVVLGGHPARLLAAMAPMPPGEDVTGFAQLLEGSPCESVQCRTLDLAVAADAEIVIEGYVDPAEPPIEVGLLGASGGGYQTPRRAPVMHVTAVTHRANPVFPAMVPSAPPDELCVANRFLQLVFLPLVRLAVAEVVDYDLPMFGAARHWALVSIRKTYAGQARKVANALWGLRQTMFAKLLVIVDQEVDVRDHEQVWLAVSQHADLRRDVFFQDGPVDPVDPAGASEGLARRMAIDATAKLPEERRDRRPHVAEMTEQLRRLVDERWPEYRLGPQPSG